MTAAGRARGRRDRRAATAHDAGFLAAAATPARLPRWAYPEVAFAGRSNVGKSSLLNQLAGRHGLAHVSKTPGRTQQINFFLIDERIVFVDLPGYGFARVPLEVKAHWKDLVEGYLTRRPGLRAVCVLVDLRRGLEDDDALLLEYLGAHRIPAIVVATKADKLGRGERAERGRQLGAAAAARGAACVITSARTGDGVAQLWERVAAPTGSR